MTYLLLYRMTFVLLHSSWWLPVKPYQWHPVFVSGEQFIVFHWNLLNSPQVSIAVQTSRLKEHKCVRKTFSGHHLVRICVMSYGTYLFEHDNTPKSLPFRKIRTIPIVHGSGDSTEIPWSGGLFGNWGRFRRTNYELNWTAHRIKAYAAESFVLVAVPRCPFIVVSARRLLRKRK